MWNMASHNGKSNGMCGPPKTNQSADPTATQRLEEYSRGWSDNSQGLHFITGKGWRGQAVDFPMLLCRQPLIPSPPLLEINGTGVISQQPALSPRTNQCDHEESKCGIVFKEGKFAVGELVRFVLFSFFPLSRTVRKEQAYPHLRRLSHGANYKLHSTQPLHTSVLINHI